MVLSKSCEYGLRALTYLATLENDRFYSIRSIADELNLSFHFLTKILQSLSDRGIIHSVKGPRGGIVLARHPSNIKLIEVVAAIDGLSVFKECVMGLNGCGSQPPCPLHDKWTIARATLQNLFEETTLAEAAQKVNFTRLKVSEMAKG
jgi:Rrf2 family protein